MSSYEFFSGAVEVDITPPLGTYINGDFIAHYATQVQSNLYAKAIVFKKNETLIAIIVVDNCSMAKDYVDGIKQKIFAETGIEPKNTLISCTHTHAAGSVSAVYLGPADIQYMNKLPDLIVKAAILAKENLRPAKTAWGSVHVPEHVRCRRYFMTDEANSINPVTGQDDEILTNPFGQEDKIDRPCATTDPQLSYLLIKGLDEKWIGVLANYSLHYVGDWDNGTISSDYFGEFSRQLKTNLNASDDFIGIMSNGTSGDINIWDFLNPERYPTQKYQKSKLIGEDLANRLCQSLDRVKWDNQPTLSVRYKELTFKVRKPNKQELKEAENIVKSTNFEQFTVTPKSLKKIYAREQVLLNDLPNDSDFPIQVFKIGNGVLSGLCGEIFAETGLFIKSNVNTKNYFTIGLANGNQGYIPTTKEFKRGGYETWRSRTSKLEEGADETIRQELLNQINELLV